MNRPAGRFFITVLALLAGSLDSQAISTDVYVDLNSTNRVPPYASWDTAATSIQQGVDEAMDGYTVHVTNGTYHLLTSEIVVYQDILIESVNGPAVTTVDGGGAVRVFNLGTNACTISGFTVTNGATAELGGGILCSNRTPVVTNCIVTGNYADTGAGGVLNGTIHNSVIRGNLAFRGGGTGLSVANNCLITENHAYDKGGATVGGIFYDCTIVSNTAAVSAGGVSRGYFYNCIIYYNLSPGGPGSPDVIYYSCMSNATPGGVTGNITNAPSFFDLAGGDYRLKYDSPCIDAGNNSFVVGSTDLDGNPRILNGVVDMGAYEIQYLNHYVSQSGSHEYPFVYWATAATNIQDAVDAAPDGHTVHVTNGTYLLTSEIAVDQDILIESVNGPAVTTVDGGGAVRGFNLGTNACTIGGFTVTNGATAELGGGILCSNRTPVVTNCIVTGNYADAGAGGVLNGTIHSSVIRGNVAFTGGGTGPSVANNCLITENHAFDYGGATVGGIFYDCTIVSNTAAVSAGGVSGGSFDNCIIYYNLSPGGPGSPIEIRYSCMSNATPGGVTGNITNAPSFFDLAGGDYRLKYDSPCIDAGNNSFVVGSTDLDGNPRILNGVVDMGAYEYDIATYDSDGDGVTDAVELNTLGSNPLNKNSDNDSMDDGDEWIAGTDPTNGASYFSVTRAASVPAGFVLQWEAVTNRVYSVYWTGSFPNTRLPLATGITYPQSSYTDAVHNAESESFYDLGVDWAQ